MPLPAHNLVVGSLALGAHRSAAAPCHVGVMLQQKPLALVSTQHLQAQGEGGPGWSAGISRQC